MFHSTLLLADIFSNFGRIVIGLFAVAGAFVVGNLVTALVVWALYRRFSKAKRCPPMLMRVYRLVGGVLAALIVAALFFGEGGLGLWGGGTTDGREGSGEKGNLDSSDNKVEHKKKDTQPNEKLKSPAVEEGRVRITMLGDDAKEDRFYLYEDDRQPKTLKEVQELIRQRMRSDKKMATEVAIYTYRNTSDRDNPIVKRLDRWAQEQGLRVSYREFRDQDRPGS